MEQYQEEGTGEPVEGESSSAPLGNQGLGAVTQNWMSDLTYLSQH